MINARDLILILGGMTLGIWWTLRETERHNRLIQLGRDLERARVNGTHLSSVS